jgi:hypothetical protein
MLAVRVPIVADLIADLIAGMIALLAIAAQPHAPAPVHVQLAALGRCADDAPMRVAVPSPTCALDGRVAELYRANRFAKAAEAAPAACRDEGELLRQLEAAWVSGMDRGVEPDERFTSLQRARELDLVLAGDHAAAIDGALREVVAPAAVGFLASNDRDRAESAVAVAHLLGVESNVIRAVEHELAR